MVDKPGIVIAGVCLYGGGGDYNYELELLDEVSSSISFYQVRKILDSPKLDLLKDDKCGFLKRVEKILLKNEIVVGTSILYLLCPHIDRLGTYSFFPVCQFICLSVCLQKTFT